MLKGKLNELPAIKNGFEFIRSLNQHQVIVVEGETGSGKTMVFPTLVAEVKQGQGKVVCTQNRRILCDGAASFISEQMGDPHYAGVKHRVRKEEGNMLTFKTTGTLLNEIKVNPMLHGVSTVIVDEIHELTVDQNVLLGHLKRIANSSSSFRIVLMSATLNQQQRDHIVKFFGDVAFIKVKGRTFPIETVYSGHTFEDNWFSVKNEVLQATVSSVQSLVEEGLNGTILVFLPGKGEINKVQSMLLNSLQGVPIYRLYSGVEEQEKKQAVNGTELKVVLATNVARSGLTIENCVAVVSSGYTRNPFYETKHGYKGIKTIRSDESSIKQEGGRTGRTCEGKHIIIGTEKDFSDTMFSVEDIGRAVLSVLSSGISIKSFEWFYRPDGNELVNTQKFLTQIGALDRSGITELGRAISQLPVDLLLGKLLIESKKLGVEKEGANLVSFIVNQKHMYDEVLYFAVNYDFEKDKEVEETKQELLQALKEIKVPQEISEEPMQSLRKAVIRTFGIHASIYVPKDTYVPFSSTALDGITLNGERFMNYPSNDDLEFQCEHIYLDELEDDDVIIPLHLFATDRGLTSQSYLKVKLDELKSEIDTTNLELLKKGVENKKEKMRQTYQKDYAAFLY